MNKCLFLFILVTLICIEVGPCETWATSIPTPCPALSLSYKLAKSLAVDAWYGAFKQSCLNKQSVGGWHVFCKDQAFCATTMKHGPIIDSKKGAAVISARFHFSGAFGR